MATVKSAVPSSVTEYTVSYPLSRGMDTSSELSISRDRLAYIENMYRDYEGGSGGALESVPGYRLLASFGKRINGIHSLHLSDGTLCLMIHSGDVLHKARLGELELLSAERVSAVPDGKSISFGVGGALYILDTENIHRVDKEGNFTSTSDDTLTPYIPTAYVNGEEYEARNMLTNEFIESVSIDSFEELSFGSPGIYYRITDTENRLCATYGLSPTQTAYNIYIPKYTEIDGIKYRVTEIGEDSFRGCFNIKTITISEGVHTIGAHAFCDCTALESVAMPSSLATIGTGAFLRCLRLNTLYFGISISKIAEDAFVNTPSAKALYYEGREEDFYSITASGYVAGEGKTFTELYKKPDAYISLPIRTRAKSVVKVVVDGYKRNFDYTTDGRVVTGLHVKIYDMDSTLHKEAKIYCEYADPITLGDGIVCEGGKDMILGSTVVAEYDGRIFLSGNPSAKGYVFYSQGGAFGPELYFPEYNYFKEGSSGEVTAMLNSLGALLVFTKDDEHGGCIYYHTARDTGLNMPTRIYPISYIHSGVCAKGGAISFYDDPVFLTRGGLFGIDKQKISLDRAIGARSHNINSQLICHTLDKAMLALWCGYLAIFIGDRIYLADSRATFLHPSGSYEYEWYMISGVGSPTGVKESVYIYSDTANEHTAVHKNVGLICENTVYSAALDGGETYYYSEEGGVRYALYNSGMVRCENMSEPSAVLSVNEERLIFGTECGDIFCFNNDLRGVAPPELASMDDFDEEEYRRNYGSIIHPSFYSFGGITPRYAVRLPLDDCSIPYLTKSTVRGSLIIKCRYRGDGEVITEVATDKNGYSEISGIVGGAFDFSSISFDKISLSCDEVMTIPIMECERGWVEKQIAIYSLGYNSPIALHSVSYRYKIKGKIKKQ